MTIQHLPTDVAILPYKLQRKRKLEWLMLCSWQKQETKYFLLPSSSPRCCLERLLKACSDKLIVWKSVSLKPDFSPSIDSLKMLPAKDQEMVNSMKRRYAKRVIWKQLEIKKEPEEAMGYNDSAEFIITQISTWKCRVASERYANKTVNYLESQLMPDKKHFNKTSLRQRDGFNIDLIDFQIKTEDLSEYPNW
jgi:hypothetical protein